MFNDPLIQDIAEKYKPIWALEHASSLLEWDLETYMPVGASKSRGFAQAHIALMKQERSKALASLVSEAENLINLNDSEKGILRVVKLDTDYYARIPPELLQELNTTATEAPVVWRKARRKSDFSMFKGYLEKMVSLKRQEAEKLGYEGHPYNALMDRYEEGLTTTDVDEIFSALAPGLKRILSKVHSKNTYPSSHPLESVSYGTDAMKRVNEEVLALLGMPRENFRIDISTHPFTTGLSTDDVRVTTRYEGRNFKESLFPTIHECGHALYELQIDHSLEYTPISRIRSLGVHESQSRFWENFVGRSREFTSLVYPVLRKHLPFISVYTEDDVCRYFNLVRPSLIRVVADELTYNFHIMVRYEIEKKLIGGDISVSEAPSLWNDMMEEYVGVRPKNDAEGVLQDIHWSSGLIGYFPTYSLGNIIAGMVSHEIQKDMDLSNTIRRGELGRVKAWLKEHVHKYGAIYSPRELQKKLFGETYNPEHLLNYLERKYLA